MGTKFLYLIGGIILAVTALAVVVAYFFLKWIFIGIVIIGGILIMRKIYKFFKR